jgi:hypothetical protein
MTRALPEPVFVPINAEEYLRQATLLKALHAAHPVQVGSRVGFVHTVRAQQAGGRIQMDVYLAGDPAPIDSSQVDLQQQPE